MAGNWQMVMNSRWAVLPSMASMSGLSLSHRPTFSGRPTVGCPAGSDTRSREGRSSTAGVHWPSGCAEEGGRVAAQGAAGQLPGPGVHGHHHLGRGFHLLVRILVEDTVADAQVAVLLVGVAVNSPEAVLLLAPQRPFGGVEAGVGEGGPEVFGP